MKIQALNSRSRSFRLTAALLLSFLCFMVEGAHSDRPSNTTRSLEEAIMGWTLPVFPSQSKPNESKDIPHEFYIVARDEKARSTPNIRHMQQINPDVQFHFFSPDEANDWMKREFSGTSVLWAYEMINPLLIAAKIDLWRLAILWLRGGVYIDDDSLLGDPLASIIATEDEFIYGLEGNPYRPCFVSTHPLGKHTEEALVQCCHVDSFTSTSSQSQMHQSRNQQQQQQKKKKVHHANQMVNWLIFSRPQHAFLEEALRSAVLAIGSAYRNETYIAEDELEKNKLTCSTGPGLLTAAVLAVIDRDRNSNSNSNHIKFRNAGVDFKRYKGEWLSRHYLAIARSGANRAHHNNLIQKDKVPLLREFQ